MPPASTSTHVPYKGESAALTDLMGGQIQLDRRATSRAAIGLIERGQAARARRHQQDAHRRSCPTCRRVREWLPGFENAGWFGLMAPAGTPPDVIDKI